MLRPDTAQCLLGDAQVGGDHAQRDPVDKGGRFGDQLPVQRSFEFGWAIEKGATKSPLPLVNPADLYIPPWLYPSFPAPWLCTFCTDLYPGLPLSPHPCLFAKISMT